MKQILLIGVLCLQFACSTKQAEDEPPYSLLPITTFQNEFPDPKLWLSEDGTEQIDLKLLNRAIISCNNDYKKMKSTRGKPPISLHRIWNGPAKVYLIFALEGNTTMLVYSLNNSGKLIN